VLDRLTARAQRPEQTGKKGKHGEDAEQDVAETQIQLIY
jgi:hypothetical protein